MNLWFRLIWRWLTYRVRSRCSVMGTCVSKFRVWPSDLDALMHMNNGKYFAVLDLARIDLLLRSGFFSSILRSKWVPLVQIETMSFRRSLKVFQTFEVRTDIIGWSERGVCLQQTFVRDDHIVAQAHIITCFRKPNGALATPSEIAALARFEGEAPMLPDWVVDWMNSARVSPNGCTR